MTRADQIDEYGVATITFEGDNYTAALEVDWAAEWCEVHPEATWRDNEQVFTAEIEHARVARVVGPTGNILGGCWHERAKREWLESASEDALCEQVWDAAGCGRVLERDEDTY